MGSYLQDKIDFSQVQRVLVIKLQHLGDVLLVTPVLSVLKQCHPHLEIDALVYADTEVMLRGNPDVERIFTIDLAWRNSPLGKIGYEVQLYRRLKDRNYQLIIGLTDRMRAAWLSRLLRPRYSVAQKHSHKRGKFWRNSFSHLYTHPRNARHIVEVNLDALRRLGLQPKNAVDHRLRLTVSPQDKQTISDLLAAHNLQPGSYIVMHPLSRWMFKGWNTSGFAHVIDELSIHGITTVVVSGPDPKECAYVQAILSQLTGTAIDLAGKLSLFELATLISQAKCFIGLDSVATHIAAAVNTPCVTLFGPSNEILWHPWHVPYRIVQTGFSCRPCGLEGCGNSKISDCLQAITPQMVIAPVLELIENIAPYADEKDSS